MKLLALSILAFAISSAQSDSDVWTSYGKNSLGWRYSELDQINTSTVSKLAAQWMYQTNAAGKNETTPLVFDHMMFVTGPNNSAWALDALTGRLIWSYRSAPQGGLNLCCGAVNRGFAQKGNKLFKVNLDATVLALDATSGAVLWQTAMEDFKKGYTATAAPLIVKNMVITGMAGAEFGTRGFIDAYDSATGKRLWRFYTVPGPDLNGDIRPGDNLYACSVVALDADTGKLRWHYQFTPHDVHDWDAVQDPIPVDLSLNGRPVKALIQANRNGFFYMFDRTNGKLLQAKAYTKVTWADGIAPNGRPITISGQDPTEEGNR